MRRQRRAPLGQRNGHVTSGESSQRLTSGSMCDGTTVAYVYYLWTMLHVIRIPHRYHEWIYPTRLFVLFPNEGTCLLEMKHCIGLLLDYIIEIGFQTGCSLSSMDLEIHGDNPHWSKKNIMGIFPHQQDLISKEITMCKFLRKVTNLFQTTNNKSSALKLNHEGKILFLLTKIIVVNTNNFLLQKLLTRDHVRLLFHARFS